MPDGAQAHVEIGPGLGDLTERLILKGVLTAVEIDEQLCVYLRDKFKDAIHSQRLNLVCGDVLKRWESQESLIPEPYDLVANLPYYVATNIILRALDDPMCQHLVVMVQKEVAQKFAATVGKREYGALAVLAQEAGTAHLLFDVPPEAFDPVPKVVSAVLRIDKDKEKTDPGLSRLLRIAFAQPRKTLRKNLLTGYPEDQVDGLFNALELPPQVRPHQVPVDLFRQLAPGAV